jgi:FixJ family two-component response regulator
VIFISGHGDIPMAVQAMRQGAIDFLQKPFSEQALIDRINHAIQLSQERRQKQVGRSAIEARYALLTAREKEVLAGIVRGSQNKQIADELGISTRTVEQHRAHIMQKMRVGSLAELVAAVGQLPG